MNDSPPESPSADIASAQRCVLPMPYGETLADPILTAELPANQASLVIDYSGCLELSDAYQTLDTLAKRGVDLDALTQELKLRVDEASVEELTAHCPWTPTLVCAPF